MDLEVSPQDLEKLKRIFEQQAGMQSFVIGKQARDIFLQSGLPSEILGKVWQLADRNNAGQLDLHEFTLAMYLITKIKQGVILAVPTQVPPQLWQSITQPGVDRSSSVRVKRTPTLQKDFSASSIASGNVMGNVSIPESQKQQHAKFFEQLDIKKAGKLSGQECYGFFLKSGLPSTDLAVIWELVAKPGGFIDIEGFSTAMDLIQRRLAGQPLPLKTHTNMLDLDFVGTGSPRDSPKFSQVPMTPQTSYFAVQRSKSYSHAPMTPVVGSGESPALGNQTISNASPQPIYTPPSGLVAPMAIIAESTSFEEKEVEVKEQSLKAKAIELESIEDKLIKLRPAVADLSQRRKDIDLELAAVSEKRANVAQELTKLRQQYDTEYSEYQELQRTFGNENMLLQAADQEINRLREGMNLLLNEKKKLEISKQSGGEKLAGIKKSISELTEKTAITKQQIFELEEEIKKQQQFVQINSQILQSSEEEYRNVKYDLDLKTQELEMGKQRALKLEQKASVQAAITQKELDTAKQIESVTASLYNAKNTDSSNQIQTSSPPGADNLLDLSTLTLEQKSHEPKKEPSKDTDTQVAPHPTTETDVKSVTSKAFSFDDQTFAVQQNFNDFSDFTNSSQFQKLDPIKPTLDVDAAFGGTQKQASNNPFDPSLAPEPIPSVTKSTPNGPSPPNDLNVHKFPEKVNQLTQMGFSKDQSQRALEMYDYDLQRASNYLLEGVWLIMKALNQQLNTANRSLLYVMSSYFTVKNANTAVMALTVIGSGANLIGILMLNLQGIIWYIALVYATTGLTYTVTYQKDIQRTYLGILQVLITISIIYVPSDFMSTVALYSQDNSQGFIKLAGLVGYSIGVFGALLLTGTEKDSIIHRQLKQ